MHLSRFPRLHFAHLPTPLEPLERLSNYLGGPEIYIKRDDCTGLATGGNKTRKLEFSMGEALEQGLVELARRAEVYVLDARTDMAQLGGPHPALELPGASVCGFAVDQQTEPFGMAEVAGIVAALEFRESVRHAVEPERTQLVVGGMVEHVCPLQ